MTRHRGVAVDGVRALSQGPGDRRERLDREVVDERLAVLVPLGPVYEYEIGRTGGLDYRVQVPCLLPANVRVLDIPVSVRDDVEGERAL